MTVQPAPVKSTPWLAIVIGVIVVLCLCILAIGAAGLAFFSIRSSTVKSVATEEPMLVEETPDTALPTEPAVQADDNPLFVEAAPVGTAADLGNDMTLTVLDVTRPADDIVANGSVLNTAAPEGEEFMQVDVEVTCGAEAGSQCTFFPTVMKVVLPDGSTRDLQTFIEGVEDWDTAVDIEGGETQQGILLFIVPTSATEPVLSYQDIYADQPVYLQLP